MRVVAKILIGMVITLAAVLVLLMLGVSLFQDRLRTYAEQYLNEPGHRYEARIGTLAVRPLRLALEVEGIVVRHKHHPDPAVIEVPSARAELMWRGLLSGTVAGAIAMDHPTVRLTRSQVAAVTRDAKEKAPSVPEQQTWQEKALSLMPLSLSVTLRDGDVTYIEEQGKPPLHLTHLNVYTGPVRNVRSDPGQYPTEVRLDSAINEEGRVRAEGHLDVFAKPHPSAKAHIAIDNFDLGRLLPLTSRYHVRLYQGRLSTEGSVEFAPWSKLVRLDRLTIDHALANYIYEPQQRKPEKHAAKKAGEKAAEVARQPETLIHIEHIKVMQSEFGVVHAGADPPYRAFFNQLSVEAKNFSNRVKEKTAEVVVKGSFMGTGMLEVRGMFRPETNTPDFDVSVRLVGVQAKMLNDMLRAHGNIDVADGDLSVYSQLKVKEGHISGYVKPLITRLNVYDRDQDRGKGPLQTLYEGALDAATDVLENDERDEVGTKVDVTGEVGQAHIDTWQAASSLVRNAFVQVVLPAFERPIRPGGTTATLGVD